MTDGASRWLDRDGILAALAGADSVAILATDTVPGLHARIDRPRALERLSMLKKRPLNQSYVILCADAVEACGFASRLSSRVREYLDRLWPGPFSAILVAGTRMPAAVIAVDGTVAVRVPGWGPLRDLLRRSGPLASTSVNLTGEVAAGDLDRAATIFPHLPVWREPGPVGSAGPSALVSFTAAAPVVLREGPRPLPPWSERA